VVTKNTLTKSAPVTIYKYFKIHSKMLQFVALKSSLFIFIALAALHLFMFHDLFGKIHTLRSDIIEAIKDATPLSAAVQMTAPVKTPPPVTCPACPACSVEDAEKWRNLLRMKNVVPQGR